MLAEDLIALASLAGNTVVAAAVTDAWEAAREKFARLLGRGDPARTRLAEQRLGETRDRLANASGSEWEQVRSMLAERWELRIADLLEEDPSIKGDLLALVREMQAALPIGVVSASGHAVAAGRDVNVRASDGSIAAAVIQGDVARPNPTVPGPTGS